jgi:radical S-adenosyl methionine domain-containing protein 2
MLPVLNDNLAVSQSEFDGFVIRHQLLNSILCAEDNTDMTESYIMIDPHGRFFQNSDLLDKTGYYYSASILNVGAKAAFSGLTFSTTKFLSRYEQEMVKVTS